MSKSIKTAFLILPIHLFDHSIFLEHIKPFANDLKTIYIMEEPVYFGDRENQLNFNKIKLIYHRATMQYYHDYIKNYLPSPDTILEYLDYNQLKNAKSYQEIKRLHSRIIMFNPIDTLLEAKYKKIFATKLKPADLLETPLFLCTSTDLEDFHKKKVNKDSYFHASFYTWQRERLANQISLPVSNKTYDTENRNMMPLDTNVPPLPKNDSKTPKTKKYLTEAIAYVQHNWSHNLEPVYVNEEKTPITETGILFPITHKTSLQWLEHFCQHRLNLFGKYEDSIDSGGKDKPRNFLFHSAITPMLNIGLITPHDVITIVTNYYNKHKSQIGIANYEGFIRQIIGWREYQRYIYQYAGNVMRKGNHFNNSYKLTPEWYNGTIGIKPVDDAIKMAMNDGYIHHILRLMVVGNFMNLVGIHPDQVYKWFMEFSLDSYDWVMIGNVYSMALWADGGLTMRKPYISGDGYIMKMSNYNKGVKGVKDVKGVTEEDWNTKWNAVFHHFIDRNTELLAKTYYNGLVKAWKRKTDKERQNELAIANKVISNIILH
jgi:deoxyribodipyrimidine photolyase-related protein